MLNIKIYDQYRYKFFHILIKLLSIFFISKKKRRKVKATLNHFFKVDYRKNEYLQDYLKKYTNISSKLGGRVEAIPVDQLPIWQLWLQGKDNAPLIVQKCLNSVQKYAGTRKVILLTEDNLSEFVDIPDFILEKKSKGIISNTHFSDILRICLLEKYGGTWIDATVYLTGHIPDEILKQEFFAFAVPESHPSYDFHLFSSWFLHAQPNLMVIKSIKETLYNYWKNEDELIDYFTLHLVAYNIFNHNDLYREFWNKVNILDNIAPHALQFKLHDNYDANVLDKIKKDSNIHKLTYKIDNNNKNSFLDYFIKDRL